MDDMSPIEDEIFSRAYGEEEAPADFDEQGFRDWYDNWATTTGLDPDPDHPEHYYDYRAAYTAGVEPSISDEDGKYHWPSQFKSLEHPNRVIGGIDTATGEDINSLWDQAKAEQMIAPPPIEEEAVPESQWNEAKLEAASGLGETISAGVGYVGSKLKEKAISDVETLYEEAKNIVGVGKRVGEQATQFGGDLAAAVAGFARAALRGAPEVEARARKSLEENEKLLQARRDKLGIEEPPEVSPEVEEALKEHNKVIEGALKDSAEALQQFAKWLPDSPPIYGEDRPIARFIEDSITGVVRFAPAMGITAISAGAALPLTYAQIFGASYRDKLEKNIPDQAAFEAAQLEALLSTPMEFGGNLLGLKFIKGGWQNAAKAINLKGKAAAVIEALLFSGAGEGLEEAFQQFPQELANIYAENYDKSAEEIAKKAIQVYGSMKFLKETAYAAGAGALGGMVMAGAGMGAHSLATMKERRQVKDVINEQVGEIQRAVDQGMMSQADLQAILKELPEDSDFAKQLGKIAGAAPEAAYQYTPASEEDIKGLTGYLQSTLPEGSEVKVQASGEKMAEMGRRIQAISEAIGGSRAMFFKADGAANSLNGVYDEATDTLWINESASDPYLRVLGHETTHRLKTQAPELFEQLSSAIQDSGDLFTTWLKDLNEARTAAGLEALKPEDALAREEHLSDFVGQQFANEDFWKKLNDQDPGLAKKIADIAFQIIEKIRKFFSEKGITEQDAQLVSNLDQAQDAMAKVFSEYSRKVKEKSLLQKGVEAVGEALGPAPAEAKIIIPKTAKQPSPAEKSPKPAPAEPLAEEVFFEEEPITEEEWQEAAEIAKGVKVPEKKEKPTAEVHPTETQPEVKTIESETQPELGEKARLKPEDEFKQLWETLTPEQQKRLADIPGDEEIDYPSKIQMVKAELATKRAEKPKVEAKKLAASVTTGEKATTLRGRIRAMGGINFLNFKGELKEMPLAVKMLAKKAGEKIDLAEGILRDEGWLDPEEKLLDVLRDPKNMRRGRIMGGGPEKLEAHRTEEERRLAAEMEWEAEAPPEGAYIQMAAEDLPEGKDLVILDGKTARGWDIYHVVEKDPFGVVLQDGTTITLAPNDLVEVIDTKKKDIAASVKRLTAGPGGVQVEDQARWMAQNRERRLPEIEVQLTALDETGKSYKVKENASAALKELKQQEEFSRRLLECLNS